MKLIPISWAIPTSSNAFRACRKRLITLHPPIRNTRLCHLKRDRSHYLNFSSSTRRTAITWLPVIYHSQFHLEGKAVFRLRRCWCFNVDNIECGRWNKDEACNKAVPIISSSEYKVIDAGSLNPRSVYQPTAKRAAAVVGND
jgi:hypothetical protein